MSGRAIVVVATFNGLLKNIFETDKQYVKLISAPTIGALLETLCHSPERRERILDKYGNLRKDITILRNGRSIIFLGGLDTELDDGDTVAFFPPICGG